MLIKQRSERQENENPATTHNNSTDFSELHWDMGLAQPLRNDVRFRYKDTLHYRRRPRRPPFLRVESVGMGVTSSAPRNANLAAWNIKCSEHQLLKKTMLLKLSTTSSTPRGNQSCKNKIHIHIHTRIQTHTHTHIPPKSS